MGKLRVGVANKQVSPCMQLCLHGSKVSRGRGRVKDIMGEGGVRPGRRDAEAGGKEESKALVRGRNLQSQYEWTEG